MEKKNVKDWFLFIAPRLCAMTLIAGVIVRIILLCMPITEINFGFWQFVRLFLLGAVNDLAFSFIGLIPAFLVYVTFHKSRYSSPYCWILGALLLALTVYVVFFNDITDEYGAGIPIIADALLILFLVSFGLKLFFPRLRKGWEIALMYITMAGYSAFTVLIILIGEPVFWEEFGVRYNFIAVDYLVYTTEVIGNIIESYPMVPVCLGVLALSALFVYLMVRGKSLAGAGVKSVKSFLISLEIVVAGSCGGAAWLHWSYRSLATSDMFLTQLQENGCWDFLEAFTSNELKYDQFYPMLPDEVAMTLKKEFCGQDDEGIRHIVSESEENRKNIVLIMIESLSADFFAAYGNDEGITPNLDALMDSSLVFDNLYATGNRTVRGLEAVTLCIPPSSGESIVKRPGNGGLFSTGTILREKGYSTSYIYGGYSYFDNMDAFFGGNGYKVIDRNSYDKDAIIFANIWGTCDEDSYREALAIFDAKAAEEKPFFAHLMTISNHRPYTYPEGRIEYEGGAMTREAAVKYTDYAIGQFLREARTKEWFDDTVFVILADHCASSAGKTSLPLDCYHIPAIIYAPGFVEPRRVDKVCSQIDLMPTLFGLLGFSYDSSFYGQDILSEDYRERAFMATYQDLGYYADGVLTVLSPIRQIRQYEVTLDDEGRHVETLMEESDDKLAIDAQVFYQAANLEGAHIDPNLQADNGMRQ